MSSSPRGPKLVLAKAWVATAPALALAHGTTAPTAGNFDATATPQACALRSQATIENVETENIQGLKIGHGSHGLAMAVKSVSNHALISQLHFLFYRRLENLIHQAILNRLLCIEIIITVGIALNDFKSLARVLCHDFIQ